MLELDHSPRQITEVLLSSEVQTWWKRRKSLRSRPPPRPASTLPGPLPHFGQALIPSCLCCCHQQPPDCSPTSCLSSLRLLPLRQLPESRGKVQLSEASCNSLGLTLRLQQLRDSLPSSPPVHGLPSQRNGAFGSSVLIRCTQVQPDWSSACFLNTPESFLHLP